MTTGHIVWTPAQAERLARFAHEGQLDKSGVDYYAGHLRGTVSNLRWGTGRSVRSERYVALTPADRLVAEMVAWLHDVVEDTPVTIRILSELGAPYAVWNRISLLTRSPHSHTDDYYRWIRGDPVARAVKEADINSNTDPARVSLLDEETQARLAKKYAKARKALGLEDPWES